MGYKMSYFVYILRNPSKQLYIGQTNNLDERLHLHKIKDSKAAKFTRDGTGFTLVYQEEHATRLSAMRREMQLKKWTRAKKESLINGNLSQLKELSKRKVK